jgi:acyl-coenzyme A synthetase/AMP-(fatty) acid ligase
MDRTWADMRDAPNTPLPGAGFTDRDAICRLFTSSGTTGTQKVIGHTVARHETMAIRGLMLDPQAHGVVLSMMWMSTIGGWGTIHMTLMHGGMVALFTDPLSVLRAINLYHVRFLRASPQQLQSLVEIVRGFPVRYPSLAKIELAGASVPSSLLLAARAVLCPTIVSIYGSTEAGLVAQVSGALLHAVPDAGGYPVPDVQVRVVDAEGRPVANGEEGTIHLRTPQLTDCYIGDPEASAQSFRDGWFIPGDLGVLRDDGLLRITGRIDEIINTGGVKVNPAVLDEFLRLQPGVADAAAFAYRRPGQRDQVWAAVVAKDGFDERQTLAAAVQRFNARAPVKLVRVDAIPRNAMGKAMRQKLTQEASR